MYVCNQRQSSWAESDPRGDKGIESFAGARPKLKLNVTDYFSKSHIHTDTYTHTHSKTMCHFELILTMINFYEIQNKISF